MIKAENSVAEDEVITVLNQRPPSPDAYARFIEDYWRATIPDASPSTTVEFCSALDQWTDRESETSSAAFTTNYLARAPELKPLPVPPEHGWSLPHTISRKRGRSMGEALVSAHLRTLVDEWLETGRDPDGTEWPSRRDLSRALTGWNVTCEFLEQSQFSMRPASGSSGFILTIAQPDWKRPSAGDFFAAQKVESERLFVGILASDWQQRLCKCRYEPCGRYFVGTKLRQCYRHGTFCSCEHLGRASADALTKARRSKARRYLIEEAGKWLLKRGCIATLQNDRSLKQSLAEFLSKQIGQKPILRAGREPVKVNWVSAIIRDRRFLDFCRRRPTSSRRRRSHPSDHPRWGIVATEWLEHRHHPLTDFARADVSPPTAAPCLLCVAAATEASAIAASPAGSESGGDRSWQPAIATRHPKRVRKHIGTASALIGNGNPARV